MKKKVSTGRVASAVYSNLPMPHSVNRGFFVSRGRIIKSSDSRFFDKHMADWAAKNKKQITEASCLILSWVNSGMLLRVDVDFFFNKKRLFSKSPKAKAAVKSVDLNNRLKPLLDWVARLSGVDDKFYFEHFLRKLPCQDGLEEHVMVTVSPIDKIF